ncbi:hypothetical protein [Candidatus Halocynthiibacter alkanivorans]|uniref:hypothetical protein n=1 Tax=Candidatus Halocynthiibacter alkanivorans TaxID=2267619 RepID=UPI00109C2A28|nr:hypothetical protein [Candidatus Halocynthiibacter alkanivorans]
MASRGMRMFRQKITNPEHWTIAMSRTARTLIKTAAGFAFVLAMGVVAIFADTEKTLVLEPAEIISVQKLSGFQPASDA